MTFEILLLLPNQPGKLRSLLGIGLVPTCIKLLKEYCKLNLVRQNIPYQIPDLKVMYTHVNGS